MDSEAGRGRCLQGSRVVSTVDLKKKKQKQWNAEDDDGVCKHGKRTVAKPDIEKYLLNEAARGVQSSPSIHVQHSG